MMQIMGIEEMNKHTSTFYRLNCNFFISPPGEGGEPGRSRNKFGMTGCKCHPEFNSGANITLEWVPTYAGMTQRITGMTSGDK